MAILILLGASAICAAEPASRDELVAQAKSRLQADLLRLDQHLAKSDRAVAVSWKKYLGWNALVLELERQEPDAAKLADLLKNYYRNQPGVEAEEIRLVRESLRQYQLLSAIDRDNFDQARADRRQELAERLAQYEASPTREAAWQIGELAGWIEVADPSAVELLRESRKKHSQRNGFAFFSARLANHLLTRDVYEREYVSTMVAGSMTSGMLVTKAKLTTQALTSPDKGMLEIALIGEGRCDETVAVKGPVTVFGGAVTSLDGRVRLLVDDERLTFLPATTSANTQSHIDDICANNALIERIAWRKAPKKLPEAEAEASRHAEQRLAERMNQETGTLVSDANSVYARLFRKPLLRTGAWPGFLCSSEAAGIKLELQSANRFQLAAPSPPPADWRRGDVAICAHESMPENLLENLLGGREFTDKQFLYLMDLMTGESPRQLWVHEREPRWSVVLSPQRPFRLTFQGGRLKISLAIAETIRGNVRTKASAIATATFDPLITADGPAFKRVGELELSLNEEKLDAAAAADLRRFLMRKFGAVLPPELYFDGLAAPAGGYGDRIRQLEVGQLRFENGWAMISYKLGPPKVPAAQSLANKRP